GDEVATGGWDRKAVLWNASNGDKIQVFPHQGRVRSLAFSPDGTRLLTGDSEQTARLFDLETHQEIGQGILHQDVVYAVAFDPPGELAPPGCADYRAPLWRLPRRPEITSRHQAAVTAVRFGPGPGLVTTGSLDKTARVWDIATGKA